MNKIERIFCSGLRNLEVGVVYRNLKVARLAGEMIDFVIAVRRS